MFLVIPVVLIVGLGLGAKYSRLNPIDSCMLASCFMSCLSVFVTVMDPVKDVAASAAV